jgi:tetratricopeptide (TPR) repeat protein
MENRIPGTMMSPERKHLSALLLLTIALLSFSQCGPDKAIKYYNLGLDAAQRNDYDGAIGFWNESLKHRPDDADTRFNLGAALIALKRYPEAEVQLRKAVELNPLDPDAQQLLGKSLEEQDSLSEAKHAYEFALDIKPSHAPSLVGLASVLLRENQNKSAEDYATRAVELDPRNLEANLLLSEAYFRNGDINAAYGQLLSVRRLEPANPAFLLLFGKVTYERRMYADARESLEAARTLGTSTDELFYYLGLTNLALGNAAEAQKDFRLAIYKNSEYAMAWRGLGETYIKEKKWHEAAEAIAKALSIKPDDPETALDSAIVQLNSGDPGTAAHTLEALLLRSDAPQITGYYLGHAYLRMGKNSEARVAFMRFAQMWEGNKSLADEARELAGQLAP